jgi:DNA-binding response OmpR family regulator
VVTVLLIDDDRRFTDGLAEYLQRNGLAVSVANDAAEAERRLAGGAFAVILLDLMLPDADGLDLARRIRAHSTAPIIMVSARGDDVDRIVGLETGADDYLAKPFNPRELLARVRAVLRRVDVTRAGARFVTGSLVIDFDARRVELDGREVSLTAHEFDLLAALARNAGRVLTRDQLLEITRAGGADEVFDRAVDVIVSRLRQKIEADPRAPRYLKTIRGVGYALNRVE